MKSNNIKLAIISLLLVSAGIYVFLSNSSDNASSTAADSASSVSKRGRNYGKKQVVSSRRVRSVSRKVNEEDETTRVHDVKRDSSDEEKGFTVEQRALWRSIQDAMDNDDWRAVAKTAEKVASIIARKGYSAVPPSIRAKLVEALGFFGAKTVPELVSMLGDPDPEIADDAMNYIDSVLNDTTLGDRELSEIIKVISKGVTSEDSIDSILMSVETSMRHSVAVDTYISILQNGSEAIKSRAMQSIADFTDDESVTTLDKLREWLENNPDDEDDEELYKGVDDEAS